MNILILCLLALAVETVPQDSAALGKRTAFSLPLAKLSAAFDDDTRQLINVKVTFEGDESYAIIRPIDDESIEYSAGGRKKVVHREPPEAAYLTSEFEARQLRTVTHSLMETLVLFEKDLQRARWDRCLYLDSYLPRFLRGYYYLCDAIRNSQDALPPVGRIPETAFDVSLNSPKSDERVAKWRDSPDNIIKLRIICKELVFQMKKWEADTKKGDHRPESFFSSKLKMAYSLFIRVYFNLNPPAKVPAKGEHL